MGKVERKQTASNDQPRPDARRSGQGRRHAAAAFPPQMAIRMDGAVLLSIEDIGDRDLTGRETFTGIVLRSNEIGPLRSRVNDAAAGAAAEIGSKLSKR